MDIRHLIILSFLITTVFSLNLDFDKLKSQLPQNFASSSSFAGVDEVKNLAKEKCKKQSGNDEAFQKLEEGIQNFTTCGMGLINISNIQNEIEQARPNGELDRVFHGYCQKRPDLITCIENFMETLQPCLNDEEKSHSQLLIRIIKSILNFVCYKGGDHIALFIAEGGPECLQEKRLEIGNCLNQTLSSYIPKDGFQSLENLPQFTFGPKQCKELQDLKLCIVNELEKCKEVTPANIIESMFRFVIKNETDCDKK